MTSTVFCGGTPRAFPTLAKDEIHVWSVGGYARDVCDPNSLPILASGERARASQFKAEVDRARFIERRVALRMILAEYLAVAPQHITFSVNRFGKPSVVAPKTADALSFNTTHSEGLALIAVGRSTQIGIDVERLRSDVEYEAIAARFFASNEAAALAALPPRDRIEGFFNAWTRKEAVVKALGRGLSIQLDSFEVSLRPGDPPVALRWNIPDTAPEAWRMHHLEPAPGYVGALVVDREATIYPCRRWPNRTHGLA